MLTQANKKPLSDAKWSLSASVRDDKMLLTIESEKKVDRYGYSSRESSIKSIHLWNTNTGERKRSISNEKEIFESVEFGPDSKTLVTIGTQREIDRLGYAKSDVDNRKKN